MNLNASRQGSALPSQDETLRTDADTLNRLARDLTADLDLKSLVQRVTDAGTQLTGAAFGAFFYNSVDASGQAYLLYTLSGAPREAFEKFGAPRKTELFGPTFEGKGPVRIGDVLADPRFGKNPPHLGMPHGHLPVRSYLAVPVVSRSGEVIGGLFFGHPDVDVFDDRSERMASGVAAHAAVAIDNARLYATAARELEARRHAEAALRASEERYRELVHDMPVAIYTTDAKGRITLYNKAAATLWGREPNVGSDLWCGSRKIYSLDGTPMPHEECPMAACLTAGQAVPGQEIIIERPDGSRCRVLPHPQPLHDAQGRLVGAVNMLVDLTTHTELQQAVHESEDRFARFMRHLPGLAWIKDAAGRYVYANEAATAVFGASSESICGKTDDDLFPHNVAARFRANDLAAMGAAAGVQVVETLSHDDGAMHHSLVSKFPIPRPDGEPALVGGMAIDITEQKRATEELRMSEARLRLALDAGRMGTWAWSLDTNRVEWSPSLEKLHGLEPGTFGGTFDEYQKDIHPDDRQQVLESIAKSLETGEDLHIEYRIFRPDGVMRWVEGKGKLLRDERGNPVRMTGVCADITERKEADRAHAYLAAIVETTQDAVISKTLDGRITSWNSGAQRLFGYSAAEAIGQSIELIIPLELRGEESVILERLGAGERIGHFETVRLAKDGRRLDISLTISPIRDSEGRLIGASKVARDISERKRSEESLQTRFRQLQTIYRLSGAVSRAEAIDEICEVALDGLREAARADRAAVLLFDGDGVMRFKCWRGLSPHYRQAVEGHSPWSRESADAQPITVSDVEHDASLAALRGTICAEGIRALAFIPLKSARHVLGKFMVYYDEVHEFTEEDIQLCEALAGHVAYAVERSHAERALRASEVRYRAIIESQSEMVCRFRLDGTILFVNGAYARARKSTPETLEGVGFWDFVAAEDQPHVRAMLEQLNPEAPEVRIENRFVTDQGERWTLWTNRALSFGDDGRPVELQSTGIDITERKRAEQALRESEDQFRRAIEDAPVPVILQAEDGEVLQISRTWTALTGYTIEDAPLFQPWLAEAYGAAGGEASDAAHDLFRSEDEMRGIEFMVTTRSGQKRHWLLNASSPGTLRDGRRYVVGMAQDITARKRVEQAMRESEARFRNMADYAPVLIWVNDCEGCTFVNREYLHFVGRPFNDVRGMQWTQFVHPDDRATYLGAYKKSLEHGQPFECNVRLRRADGTYRWLHSAGLPRFSEAGTLIGYVGSSSDIHDQIEAQQALERHGAALEAAMAQRTAELEESNQRLRLAERMASLGTLSAGLGHDIGNILIPVRVRLESLAAADLPSELHEHVEVIRTSTEYLQRLSAGLRMLASDASRTAPLEATQVSEWWVDAKPMMTNALPRGITLHTQMPADDCWIGLSRAALTQIVFNLVQNAGEATKEQQGGMVSISIEPDESSVRVVVSDNGQGMTEEVRRRCTEPFFTTKPRGLSTGLGLSLIHSLVSEAGGRIDVESQLGAGTTFTITLKRAHTEVHDAGSGSRLAVVHLADMRLQAYVCAELRSLKYNVALGLARLHEGELIIVDALDESARLPEGASVLVLQSAANAIQNGHTRGNVAIVSNHVMTTEPRPQAIREAIQELAQKYLRMRQAEERDATTK